MAKWRNERDRPLGEAAVQFEWADVKQNLRTLQEVIVEERGRTFAIRVAMGPWPYSEIYRALKAHTLVDDCRRYNLVEPVMQPEQMTLKELHEWLGKASRED